MQRLFFPALRLAAVAMTLMLLARVAEAQPDLGAIRARFEAGLRQNAIVGGSLVLVRGGAVALVDNYGRQSIDPDVPVTEATTYHWASVTKTLTGIAILQLRDAGRLSLDDPLVKYIPELRRVHDSYGPIDAITIREAMSHSSGFRDATWPWESDAEPGEAGQPGEPGEADNWRPFEPTEWSQLVAMMPYTSIHFAPGSRFRYSNLAVVFLGEIIERLSGDAFAVYMEKNLLRPLGMSHSYYDRAPRTLVASRSHSWDLRKGQLSEDPFDFDTGITRANGGLNAPMGDMTKYLQFLIGDPQRQAEYDAILKRSSLEQMWQPLLPITAYADFECRPGSHDEVAESFFVHTDGAVKLIGHSGWQNGFRSHLYFDPATRSGYLANFNTDADDGPRNTREFGFKLRDELVDSFFRVR